MTAVRERGNQPIGDRPLAHELARQADKALFEGDRESCIILIGRLYELLGGETASEQA